MISTAAADATAVLLSNDQGINTARPLTSP